MDSTSATPAAPAQPVASPAPVTPTISASEAAVSKSPREYREARRAERAGKPLAAVPAPAEAAAAQPAGPEAASPAAPAQPAVSKRQQQINDYERRIAEQAAEIARLQRPAPASAAAAPAQPPAPVPAAPAPPVPTFQFPSLQAWSEQHPDKTLEDYMDAREDARVEHRAQAQRMEQALKEQSETLTKQSQTFANALSAAKAADPDLVSKIPPAMLDPIKSIPLSALSPEQLKTATFSNLVAEAAFRSAHSGSGKPAELLKYLHAHPDETVRIAKLSTFDALIALERLDERIAAGTPAPAAAVAAPAKPKTKTLTDAPAPIATLGSRPAEVTDPETAAIRGGDTRTYRQLRREQRAASLIRVR